MDDFNTYNNPEDELKEDTPSADEDQELSAPPAEESAFEDAEPSRPDERPEEEMQYTQQEPSPAPPQWQSPQQWQQQNQQWQQQNMNAQNGYYSWNAQQKPPKKGNKAVAVLSVLLAFSLVLLVAVGVAYSGSLASPNENSGEAGVSQNVSEDAASSGEVSYEEIITNGDAVTVEPTELSKLYEKCSVSCVSVITNSALGSGFVVDTDGHIITNHHVISGAKTIKVRFYDGTEYSATLVGSDSISDIAVLEIEADDLIPIALGNSDNVSVGDSVVAIGTPYDLTLSGTMTTGIISGVAREIQVTNDYGTVVKTMTLLQTSATINPGNSGGPLIDMAGQVIGINTLKLIDDYEGLGFAIPINDAIQIANMILTYGEVSERPGFVSETPRLNITIINVSDAIAQGIIAESEGMPDGAMVIEVSRTSAIYRAGLEIYDIITEFGGDTITSKEDLTAALKKYSAGQTVTMTVYRANRRGGGGETIEMTFVLDSAANF